MRQSDDPALDAMLNKPRRCVALRRDDDEFVIAFQPEDSIAALRKVCAFLRWKIVSDTSLTADDLG
jgi:nitrite reductase/ring-hydroxylating ferredoxin subunit